jgi:hypothetical protein
MDFEASVYLSEAHNLIHPPYPLVLIHTGKGGELNQREGERENNSQIWGENTNWTDLSPVYKL